MLLNYILLHASSFMDDLPVGLALCVIPFILGWLAAFAFYGVGGLKTQIENLTAANADLSAKLDASHNENTELRVKNTQMEAELEKQMEVVRKMKNELIICEAERSNLKIAAADAAGAAGGKKPSGAASISFAGAKYKQDDLKIVEGIGPKIAQLCQSAGINTWQELSATTPERLREILDAAGPSFQIHDPGSWPKQAGLAANGEWDVLKKLQDELKGGK
ncbi:MAG: hypothetical protein IPL65_04025 [Lewinellaceae bacterium]|nr:hypothetical protein [Lewinellaceae bacterium]